MADLQALHPAVASGRILSDLLPDFGEYRSAVAARTECNGRGFKDLRTASASGAAVPRSSARTAEQEHRRRAQKQRAPAGKKHQLRPARIEQPPDQRRPDRRSEVHARIDKTLN